jgi:hypothetical protein
MYKNPVTSEKSRFFASSDYTACKISASRFWATVELNMTFIPEREPKQRAV